MEKPLEIDWWLLRQSAFDCAGAIIGEHLARAGLQRVEGRIGHALRGDLDDLQSAGQVRVYKANVQPEDLRSLLTQFMAQTIGQAPRGCLGGSVGIHGAAVDPARGG
jgi:hypothetical protein